MLFLTVVTLSAVISVTQATLLSWMTVPILLSMNNQAEGFFSLFRRRQPQGKPIRKDVPEGPVLPSIPPQSPFTRTSFSPFQNIQSFSNPFRGNSFIPQMPMHQSIFSQSSNIFSRPQMQDFASRPNLVHQGVNLQQSGNFLPEQSFEQNQQGQNFHSSIPDVDDQPPPINTEEAESFFTLLAETDENKCISRLVCEMGADPSNAGDLGQTVTEIIGSLTDFPPGSKVSEYNEILTKGRAKGSLFCLSEFKSCDQETYNIMKTNQPNEAEGENSIQE